MREHEIFRAIDSYCVSKEKFQLIGFISTKIFSNSNSGTEVKFQEENL